MKKTSQLFKHSLAASLLALTASAWAQGSVEISDPWVRATVPQQMATGAFMQITSPAGGKLIKASSPVAGVVEVHEMSMDNGVMKMRALADGLELPAGKAVELKPGGYHVMLMDLKQQVKVGDEVPLTLTFEGPDGKTTEQNLQAPVRAMNAGGKQMKKHDMKQHMHHGSN
ncbi:copper chaperone PCu(A)C [Hydrogenophaga sp. 5NK40-0174]|uniref:copper chaperone PCu(A)C n=1 Tax=Hydrogenophaga sp. 5NK40-0174 TaxID=3127649 RepID=UPI0031047E22